MVNTSTIISIIICSIFYFSHVSHDVEGKNGYNFYFEHEPNFFETLPLPEVILKSETYRKTAHHVFPVLFNFLGMFYSVEFLVENGLPNRNFDFTKNYAIAWKLFDISGHLLQELCEFTPNVCSFKSSQFALLLFNGNALLGEFAAFTVNVKQHGYINAYNGFSFIDIMIHGYNMFDFFLIKSYFSSANPSMPSVNEFFFNNICERKITTNTLQ